ncbi:MAG: lysophospholipase [Prevotella sp.]|nr:lysophospholipase [Prevotella sp.]
MKQFFFTIALVCIGVTTSAQNISGTWNGELVAGPQKIPLVLNLTDDGKCTLDSPQQGAKGIPANVDFLSADSLKVSVSSLNASYAARLENGELKGTFTQNGFKLPLSLKPGEPAKANRPQNPKPPYPYETEDVTFTNDKAGATLAGTLTIPDEAKCVLLMVTGSGAQNRDEEVFEHKPFAVIADRFARAGIATLRYDDRATGKSIGGMDANATTKDFAEDAAAGIEWLRTSKRFKKVGILGHSEGGSIAFMLGAQKRVDFIVSLAGPAVKGDSILLAQNKLLGGETAKDLTIDQLRETPAIKQSPWIQWFIDYDPQGDIAKIKCPVMALNGSKDCQVDARQNLNALRRTLPKNKQNLIKQYDGLNHLFQHCQTGLPTEYGTIEETFSEEVINDIITWVKQL